MTNKLYYKAMSKDMTCRGFQYSIGCTYTTEKAEPYESGFHACKEMEDVFGYYPMSSRIFIVELGGTIVNDDNKTCATEITIVRELSDSEIIALIKSDCFKYMYCDEVKDRKAFWSTITEDEYKYWYCRDIKDRKALWSTITKDRYKYLYCRYVKDRKALWSTIESDQYKYRYCKDVKDRKALWSTITDGLYKKWYCKDVKDREELRCN